MIQRIQTIFLFLVAVCMIVYLFFPLWQKVDAEVNEVVTINAFQMVYESYNPETGDRTLISEKSTIVISILAVVAAAISLFSIFQYHDRLKQIKLGALNSLIMAGVVGSSFYFILKAEKMLSVMQQGQYLFGFYLGMGALLLNSIANRFIRKDEKLVRESDRIR
jgi:hypothetical protein